MRYENKTTVGDVKAFRIEVTETPHSHAGKAHAALIVERRNGTESTRDGKSYPTTEEANAKALEYAAMCEKSGLVKA